MRLKDTSVQAVLSAVSIVEVVSGYTSLRKRGATYSGLCPFHQEKTPSFTVSADKGLYYCFGCGEGGDVVRFVERAENLSFTEAIEQLGERFGVPVEYEEGSGPDPGRKDREARLFAALDRAAAFYQRFLWDSVEGAAAREYLNGRGLGREVCERFRVGYSPGEWRGLQRRASKEGFTDRELDEAGLLVRQKGKTYDRFRGRLMFPLVDHRGRVLGFGGRTLKDEIPKYLNSPEGPLYQKGRLLYGLYQARKAIADADEVVVVEGYTDVLALAQAGVENAVASMGTALTEAQIGLMTRFTGNITFMFDADRAGTEAMLRSGELARGRSLRPMLAVLPGGRDPADVAVGGGREAIVAVLSGKMSLLGFELRQALARGDTVSAQGRIRLFDEVKGIMGRASSVKEREEELPLIADRLHLDEMSTKQLLEGGPREDDRSRPRRTTGVQPTLSRMLLTSNLEQDFLVAAACNPEPAARLLGTLSADHFVDPGNREVFLALRDALAIMATPGGSPVALTQLAARAHGDSPAGPLFVRLVMEADQGRYPPPVLDELYFRLQEHYLGGQVRRLQAELDTERNTEELQRRLFYLQRLLQDVRSSLINLDPEEGRA
jgi:DNA primase